MEKLCCGVSGWCSISAWTCQQFSTFARKENSHIQVTHCVVHRQALIVRELEPELGEVMNVVIIVVNFVKCNALNTRLLGELCEGADSDDSMA